MLFAAVHESFGTLRTWLVGVRSVMRSKADIRESDNKELDDGSVSLRAV
jgi:hypothetical protein